VATAARELAMAAVMAQLKTIPSVLVERNRRSPVGADEQLPRLILRDGGHQAQEDDEAGLARYAIECTVEGYVETVEAKVGAAISELHAKVVAVLIGVEIVAGPQTLWVQEGETQVEIADAADSAVPAGIFVTSFRFNLRVPLTGGPYL
jgi:hypothetical protein